MKKNKGFTLIELLVSIAIIGVLMTVVLITISAAKNKNADASVKQGLSSIPSQSGVFYLDNDTYAGFCSPVVSKSAYPIVLGAAQIMGFSGAVVNGTDKSIPLGDMETSLETPTCNNSTSAWAVEVPLRSTPNTMFCVDSAGFAGITTSSMGSNVFCPTS